MPLVSVQRVNTDQRQIPVRLRRPMMLGHLEDRADISLQISSHAVCDDRFNKCSVAVHSRGKPNCDSISVGRAMRRACFKRTRSERAEQSRDMSKILIPGSIHPSGNRVGREGQNQGGDSFIDFSVAAESSRPQVLHVGNLPYRSLALVTGIGLRPRMRRSAGRASRQYALKATSEHAAITAAIESADRPSKNVATNPLDAAPAVI